MFLHKPRATDPKFIISGLYFLPRKIFSHRFGDIYTPQVFHDANSSIIASNDEKSDDRQLTDLDRRMIDAKIEA